MTACAPIILLDLDPNKVRSYRALVYFGTTHSLGQEEICPLWVWKYVLYISASLAKQQRDTS
jgi:hypothetical protein